MPSPTLTFGFILATLLGAFFHLIVGGAARRLALYLIFGWIGFALGQVIGNTFDIAIFKIGTLRLVSASVGAIATLFLVYFFVRNSSASPNLHQRRRRRASR